MNLQSVVSEVRGRFDKLASQSQDVVKTLPETLKTANEVLINGVHSLVRTETESALDFYSATVAGLEKARSDGFRAVVSNPVSYLPSSSALVSALSESVTIVSKTGDDIYKTLKTGLMTSAPHEMELEIADPDLDDELEVVATEVTAKPAKKPRKSSKTH